MATSDDREIEILANEIREKIGLEGFDVFDMEWLVDKLKEFRAQVWKPIETAPKDRWIMGWAPGYMVHPISWLEVPEHGVVGQWFRAKGETPMPATHWAKLPDPPEGEESFGHAGARQG